MVAERPRIAVVASEPGRLGRLLREASVTVADAGLAPQPVDCVLSGASPSIVERAARLGAPIVVSGAPADSWAALAAIEARASRPVLVASPGIGTLALARAMGAVRAGRFGTLVRLSLRSPGGRRVRVAASRRTAFGPDGRARWDLDPAGRARMVGLAAPFVRLAELLVPGSAAKLAVSELVSAAGAERLVAHATVGEAQVDVEIDREVRGDEDFEVEAIGARGSLLARFAGGRDAIVIRPALRREESLVSERSSEELLVRHALAGAADPFARAGAAAASVACCEAMLEAAPSRLASRGLRVVLVHVPRHRNRFDELRLPSLAIARLAAYVRGLGFETRVVDLEAAFLGVDLALFTDDARVDAWLAGGADPALEALLAPLWAELGAVVEGRALVGFSIVDYFGHFQMNLASALARLVRARTGQRTVLGGERDQVDGDRALAPHMPFDYVVDGDGEHALYELACLEAYRDRKPAFVEAVWSRGEGGAVRKNPIVRSHLNAMPRPDFDGVPLERYRRGPSAALLRALAQDGLRPMQEPSPFAYLPYGFVKGCTADCTFCSAKEHLDVQAPDKTVAELIALSERYGVRDFVFLNNLVNLGPRWLERFCRMLVDARADLQWTDSCRPTGIDGPLAALMRESGCVLLSFGAESGSDAVLARMKKGLTRADILSTLGATHRAGILNRVNLIAGYFHETEADVDATITLVEELSGAIDLVGCFQGFYLFPGMGVDPVQEGIVLRGHLDRLRTGQATLAYDEIGGRRWEDKREAIDASRNRILARIEALGIRTVDKVDEHDLFWISRTFRDAAVTRRCVLGDPDPAAWARPALAPGGLRGRAEG